MRVKIGPYINWLGPYQIAEKLLFWLNKHEDDRVHKFGTWLAEDKHGKDSWLTTACNWFHGLQERQVYVRIDKYDTWSMDSTLAPIILPMLKQLQATKHGAPNVADKDVPEHLKSTSAEPRAEEYDVDSNHFKRWDWIMGEMIFAFECKLDEEWDSKFWTGETGDLVSTPTGETFFNPITKKDEETFSISFTGDRTCNWPARQEVQERINNGFRLFGTYFEALWD